MAKRSTDPRQWLDADTPLPASGYLYKYRSLNPGAERDHTLGILRDNRLWWGRGSRFNDPFDCGHHIPFERSDAEWQTLLSGGLNRGLGKLRATLDGAPEGLRDRGGNQGSDHPASPKTPSNSAPRRPSADAPTAAGQWQFSVQDSAGRPRSLSEVLNPARGRSLEQTLARIDQQVGVLCLSQDADNLLLWSHYANSHNGICLQFDIRRHRAAFPRLHRVSYQAEVLDLEAALQDLLHTLGRRPQLLLDIAALMRASPADDDHPVRQIERWFYTKSLDWAYEKEWRALCNRPGGNRFPARALSGIIIGCVNSAENLALIRQAIRHKRPRPKLYLARKQTDRFALTIEPLG